jgi:hypothetical protein
MPAPMAATSEPQNSLDQRLQFWRWFLNWVLGALCFWIPLYYLLFHLVIGIRLNLLYEPAAVHLAATVLAGPLFWEASRRFVSSDRQKVGMFYWSIAIYLCFTVVWWTYFGIRVSVIPHDDERAVYVIAGFGSILAPLGAYCLRKLASSV